MLHDKTGEYSYPMLNKRVSWKNILYIYVCVTHICMLHIYACYTYMYVTYVYIHTYGCIYVCIRWGRQLGNRSCLLKVHTL